MEYPPTRTVTQRHAFYNEYEENVSLSYFNAIYDNLHFTNLSDNLTNFIVIFGLINV